MLHALHIPLTGLFIGGSAVIFISLISYYSKNKTSILKATILVLIIKFIVSPYTPLPAYFSVFTEGLLGVLFFNILKFKKTGAILLGFFALLLSSFQKVFILTILFGMTIWESLDLFVNFILKQFSILPESFFSFSYLIISSYVVLHMVGGIFAGIVANRIPIWIENFSETINFNEIEIIEVKAKKNNKRKKKFWYQKSSGILFILITVFLILFSYTTTAFDTNLPLKIGIMFLRSVVITTFWFFFITPIVLKKIQKILGKKQTEYSGEVENIISLLPEIRGIIKYSWKVSEHKKGMKRIKLFLSYVFVITLK